MDSDADLRRLRRLLDDEEAEATEHLSGEELVAYHGGKLPAAEAECVKDHLVRCAPCRELLHELASFPDGPGDSRDAPPPSAMELAASWAVVRGRVATDPALWPSAAQPITREPSTTPAARPQLALWLAAALAGLLAIALGLAYEVGVLRRTNSELSQPGSGKVADLFPADDALREVESREGLSRWERTSHLTLILHLNDAPPSRDLRAIITDGRGRQMWASPALPVSPQLTLTLVLPRGSLPSGSYQVALYAPGGRLPLAVYRFAITDR